MRGLINVNLDDELYGASQGLRFPARPRFLPRADCHLCKGRGVYGDGDENECYCVSTGVPVKIGPRDTSASRRKTVNERLKRKRAHAVRMMMKRRRR